MQESKNDSHQKAIRLILLPTYYTSGTSKIFVKLTLIKFLFITMKSHARLLNASCELDHAQISGAELVANDEFFPGRTPTRYSKLKAIYREPLRF